MIITIILVGLIGIGIGLVLSGDSWNNNDIYGGAVCWIAAGLLAIHGISWLSASTNYERYVQRRGAFVQTLHNARKNGNPNEINAIAKDIATWNIELAEYKFDNKHWIFDASIDDRFENLEPIK